MVRWQGNESLYFIGQAVSYCLIALAGRIEAKKPNVFIWDFLFLLCLNNLIDELIFDPIRFGENELMFLIGAIVLTVMRYKKWTTSNIN